MSSPRASPELDLDTAAEITSLRSPRLAGARRLAKRAFRTADRRFLAEGPQAVREALVEGYAEELFVARDLLDGGRAGELTGVAAARGVPVTPVSGQVLTGLAQTVTPQGVLAVCRFRADDLGAVLESRPRLVAVLAAVRDPGNAGTVIRTADAAGAGAVLLSDASVDVYNSKCVRASAGSLFHLPVIGGLALPALVADLRAAGLQVIAADGAGERDLDAELAGGTLAAPTAWLFGNEAWGLPREVLALADRAVRVPIYGRAESLNLASAAAICLYASALAARRSANASAPPSSS